MPRTTQKRRRVEKRLTPLLWCQLSGQLDGQSSRIRAHGTVWWLLNKM